MAVGANIRKRKHQNAADDGEAAVPKKMAKKTKSPKNKNKNKNNAIAENKNDANGNLNDNSGDNEDNENNENIQEQAGIENTEEYDEAAYEHEQNEEMEFTPENTYQEVEKKIKFAKDFKMFEFRTKLRGGNFITELRHFLHLTEKTPKIIAKYLEKRGKPLELVDALERIDKANVLHASYLCQALQLVIMEVLTNQKQHMESAIQASRYFLKSHGNVLDLLLKSVQHKHRRIALKLMTALVCVEPQLGRQLLSSNDVLSNVKTTKAFLSHSKYELHEEETVRKCFIHFVLAFLVDGNTLLIRNIVDRGTLISALVSGLIFDDHVTVCVVLSTLKKYVLESAEISKTKKLHVFDLECCKQIVHLYSWRGPKGYAATLTKGENSQVQSGNEMSGTPELESVAKAAHDFLVMLLTSRKHGIAFDAITNFKQKHNALQGKLIAAVYQPWCNPLKTELIVKVLTACPELARLAVRNYSAILNPKRMNQDQRIRALDFLRHVIGALNPRLYQSAIINMTLTDLSYWIKDTCLPVETLSVLKARQITNDVDFEFRLAVGRLLLTMFTQYSNFVQAIAKRERSKGDNTMRRFRLELLSHIMLYFPTIENILISLRLSIKGSGLSIEQIHQHLDVTFDLFLVISKEHRSFIDRTNTILDFLTLLRPLYTDENITTNAEHHNIKLEMKAVKTMLLLFPHTLEPHEPLFASVLKSFIKAFVYGTADVQCEAGILLREIFKNVGIFETGELEIDLWLEALRFFDVEIVDVVTTVFINVLQVPKASVDLPSWVDTDTNMENVKGFLQKIESGLSVQAYMETIGVSKLMPLIFKGVEIVKPLQQYLETVCLLIYHYYPTPEYMQKIYEMEFSTLLPYMKSWLPQYPNENVMILEGALAKHIPKLVDLQKAVLQGDKTFEQLFGAQASEEGLAVELNGKKQNLNSLLQSERLVMIYVQQVFFIVAQLLEKQQLTREQAVRAADFMNSFLSIVAALENARKEATDSSSAAENSLLNSMLHYIYGIRLNYLKNVELFDVSMESHLNFYHFLRLLTENCNKMENFDSYTENYRLKLVKTVAISFVNLEQTKAQSEQLAESLKLLEVFKLNLENCLEIFNLLTTNLKYSDLFVDVNEQPQKTIYYDLLVYVLQSLADLKVCVECNANIRKLAKFYVQLHKKLTVDLNLEKLEESLWAFLSMAHQHIPLLGAKFFNCFFVERKLTKSSIKLACLMLERDDDLQAVFLAQLKDNFNKKEIIYPLLRIAFHKGVNIDSALLQSIYQEYKNGFMKTIEKPQKAGVIYKENVECSIALIEHCMPKSECVDFCNKNFKFDVIEIYQMRIIKAIYKKAQQTLDDEAVKQKSVVFVNFVNVVVQMLSVDLKKQFVELEKLELFAYYLYDWWQQALMDCEGVQKLSFEVDFAKILKSHQWLTFCRTCLKLGMQQNETEADKQQADVLHGVLLKLLAFLCDQMYVDYAPEKGLDVAAEPGQLFEMICTHSKCYDILLSQQGTAVKTEVLHLLYVFAKKAPAILAEDQIPVILGAYQARLNDADRYALALLQLYELYDCGLQNYRPFIWGESAISFYALRAADEERAKLTQQETSIAQVMSLIDKQLCEYTLENFPTWRKLNVAQQMPLVEFVDPELKALTFGTNSLERRIEWGITKFNENDLRFCPKRDGLFEQCYDPAFLVPLMNMCFAPEAYAHPARPVQNGMLAVTFAALSAHDKDMRLAAASAQLRYRSHFEQNKFFERPLWVQAYDNIQAGLANLRNSWMKHKRNSGTPRVPYIPCLFIAKTFNITTEPTHLLYKQLTMYLRLKNIFSFETIPEFNLLFFSPEVEHHFFRQFMIEIITNGIKTSSDLFLLVSTNTFKVLMSFYGSTMSNLDMNLLILSFVSTCAKIPGSAKIMTEQVGLISWFASVISSLEFYQFDVIEGVITIMNNFWYSLKATAADFHNYAHICLQLHRLILRLLPHLSTRITKASFAKLMNILNKTANAEHNSMSAQQLEQLINCAAKHYPDHIHTVATIKQFSGIGAVSNAAYCQQLYEEKLDSTAILTLSSLRAYTIAWTQCKKQFQLQPDERALNLSSC